MDLISISKLWSLRKLNFHDYSIFCGSGTSFISNHKCHYHIPKIKDKKELKLNMGETFVITRKVKIFPMSFYFKLV
jgi:hypothetical protein